MKYFILSICLVCGFFIQSEKAFAELNVDSRAIYDRMDRLERDITLLQRRFYKDEGVESDSKNSTQITAPEGSVQHLYAKISEMEQVTAQITAQFEELSYQVSQLQSDLKKMNADVDLRFEEIQKEEKISQPVEQKTEVVLPKDAKSAYNAAYNLLKQLQYEQAEQALMDFLATYPDDALAGNAQYWLGETYYVRRQYEQAAVAFATGFQKYKNNVKAADNLLKLGLSMQQLDKKKEACTAFKNLKKEFPDVSELILSRAEKESKKLGCNK